MKKLITIMAVLFCCLSSFGAKTFEYMSPSDIVNGECILAAEVNSDTAIIVRFNYRSPLGIGDTYEARYVKRNADGSITIEDRDSLYIGKIADHKSARIAFTYNGSYYYKRYNSTSGISSSSDISDYLAYYYPYSEMKDFHTVVSGGACNGDTYSMSGTKLVINSCTGNYGIHIFTLREETESLEEKYEAVVRELEECKTAANSEINVTTTAEDIINSTISIGKYIAYPSLIEIDDISLYRGMYIHNMRMYQTK